MFESSGISLFKGDWREGIKQIPDFSLNLIYTDPPYNMHIIKPGERNGNNDLISAYEGLDVVQANEFDVVEFCEAVWPKMKRANIYIWCAKRQVVEYMNFFVNEKRLNYDLLFWLKTNAPPTFSNKYLSDVEYCLYFHESGLVHPRSYDDARTAYVSPLSQSQRSVGHPTVKPLEFVKSHILNSSNEKDVVFDPFMGSGTTGVACKELGRKFIGCEINDNFFELAKNRIDGKAYAKPSILNSLF